MPEDGDDLLKTGGGIVHVAGVQLDLKRAPRAVVELDDGVNLPTVVIPIVEKPSADGFRIYLEVPDRKGLKKEYLVLSTFLPKFS